MMAAADYNNNDGCNGQYLMVRAADYTNNDGGGLY
jgi:hypothetical protein